MVVDEGRKNFYIYENVCQEIIQNVLDGYNGTIFVYGQTRSGTT